MSRLSHAVGDDVVRHIDDLVLDATVVSISEVLYTCSDRLSAPADEFRVRRTMERTQYGMAMAPRKGW